MIVEPANAAAIASAVAAFFAALASILIMLIQWWSFLEFIRPELHLFGWSRAARGEGDNAYEVITFDIKNLGRGSALHILIDSPQCLELGKPTTAFLPTQRLPILAPNESRVLDEGVRLHWKNVSSDEKGHKLLPIEIRIFCYDSWGRRLHKTTYSLSVVEPGVGGMFYEIVPGVGLSSRTPTANFIWSLKLRQKLARIPGLRKLLGDAES